MCGRKATIIQLNRAFNAISLEMDQFKSSKEA